MLKEALTQAEVEGDIGKTGGPLVVIPVFDALAEAVKCVQSVLMHSPESAEILVIDDGSSDRSLSQHLAPFGLFRPHFLLWSRQENIGFVRTMNQAFGIAGRRDVVTVNSDVVVGPEWLDRLKAAAYSDPRIATATPLTNHGTIVSVPNGKPTPELPPGHTVETAAAAVANASNQHYPRIPICVGHVVYIKRVAFDLVGCFDEAFSPGYSEEVDFSLRCASRGLLHVCADDVFVYHLGGASFGFDPSSNEHRKKGHELIRQRYPFYYEWVGSVASEDNTPLAGAKATASIALRGLHVLVDATCLGAELRNGTQRTTMQVLGALARNSSVTRLLALVRDVSFKEGIRKQLPDAVQVQFLGEEDLNRDFEKADVAFRPFQVHGSLRELKLLQRSAKRTIVWQLDFLSFENPFYHPDAEHWNVVRNLTRLTLGTVDGVALLSEDVLEAGRGNGLVPPGSRSRVIYPGTDHSGEDQLASKPSGLSVEGRYILCFGTDYAHKNRPFVLQIFLAMRRLGYEGNLVFAGSHVQYGSSSDAEEAFVRDQSIGPNVIRTEAVTEPEREWLFRHADLIVYPSLAEGFGLVPFEAAAAGVPCLSSRNGSLDEVLPEELETIRDWDVEESANRALKLIIDPAARARQIQLITDQGRKFSWDRCASEIVDFAREVCGEVPNQVVALMGDGGHVIATSPQSLLSWALTKVDRVSKSLVVPPHGLRTVTWVARKLLSKPYKRLIRLARDRVSISR